ncbi:MAG: hypothetical protein WDA25_01030 [Paracoccaceae bacterium]
MAKLRGAAADIAAAADAAGDVVPPPAVQARLPLADADALGMALQVQPVRGQAVGPARRVGRPKGSRNRRSEELVRFILKQHSHPLLVLAQTYSRPVHVLAAELGCTPLEAFQLQQRAAVELAPYIESKKPVAVQVDQRVIQLTIHEGDAAGGGAGAASNGMEMTLTLADGAGEENQEVSGK